MQGNNSHATVSPGSVRSTAVGAVVAGASSGSAVSATGTNGHVHGQEVAQGSSSASPSASDGSPGSRQLDGNRIGTTKLLGMRCLFPYYSSNSNYHGNGTTAHSGREAKVDHSNMFCDSGEVLLRGMLEERYDGAAYEYLYEDSTEDIIVRIRQLADQNSTEEEIEGKQLSLEVR